MKRPVVEIVVPVLNEEAVLEKNMVHLYKWLDKNCDVTWVLTIFSNGSTDKTVEIGERLAKRFPRLQFKHIPQRGRANALRLAWKESRAQIVGYMDADLSTELDAFPKCLHLILDDKFDVAVGNRLSHESDIERRFFREVLSRGFNFLIKLFFPGTVIRDAQCGFKFVRKPVIDFLIPHLKEERWFLDTELLVLAEQAGFSIAHVPVKWIERKASTVRVFSTVRDQFLGLVRLRFRIWHLLSGS